MKLDIRQPQQFAVQGHFKEDPETRGEKEIPYFSAKASTHQMKPSSPLHRVTFLAPKNCRHFVHPAVSSSQPPRIPITKAKGKNVRFHHQTQSPGRQSTFVTRKRPTKIQE